MKSDSISVFLPTRKGSQRVLNKNTRPFASVNGGLLEIKLNQLVKIKNVSEIILSTNDESCVEIGNRFQKKHNNLKIILRPDYLAADNTDLQDLIKYVPTICDSAHVLWTHVTSPFVETADYDLAISSYFESIKNGFDSLMSVCIFQNYLWSKEKKKIINNNSCLKWPRTQDIKDFFIIDSAIFITSKEIFIKQENRIGNNSALFIQDHLKSFDIDTEFDFELAEILFNKKFNV